MQTVGPYRLLQALGTCQVGGVWSATDALNNQVTVAVLSASAGRDPGWRSAFAAAANGLVQAGRLPMVTADYSAVTPWIAVAAGDGSVVAQVFVTLGMSYQPLHADPGEPDAAEPAAPEEPTAVVPPQPVSGASAVVPPQPVSEVPTTVVPPRPVSPASGSATVPPQPPPGIPPQPVSAAPAPAVVPQQPGVAVPPQPVAGMPSPTVPAASPYDAFPAGPGSSGRPRRRTGLLVGAVLLGLVALGGGGGAVALTMQSDGDGPGPTPSTSPSTLATPPVPQPATQPGIEPPFEGEWPADWPSFEAQEPVTPVTDLAGVGFGFALPEGWTCTNVTDTEQLAHYTCGPGGDAEQIGGDLEVRPCPDPCDGDRRVQMRTTVEAWGLQWVRDGGYRSYAETSQVAGEQRYGLVIVGYWRTASEGRLDRQLVFRMTGPVDRADDLRKIANSVRDAIS
jgi:hypothetical protein